MSYDGDSDGVLGAIALSGVRADERLGHGRYTEDWRGRMAADVLARAEAHDWRPDGPSARFRTASAVLPWMLLEYAERIVMRRAMEAMSLDVLRGFLVDLEHAHARCLRVKFDLSRDELDVGCALTGEVDSLRPGGELGADWRRRLPDVTPDDVARWLHDVVGRHDYDHCGDLLEYGDRAVADTEEDGAQREHDQRDCAVEVDRG